MNADDVKQLADSSQSLQQYFWHIPRDDIKDIKDSIKDKNIYININNQKCRVLGRVGTYHLTVDITGKKAEIGDEIKINLNPKYVDSSIRREYK